MKEIQTRLRRELKCAIDTARAAGELVLRLRPTLTKQTKADGSVVTNADFASAQLIRDRLITEFPHDAVLTEEDTDDPSRLGFARCWIVDPIDGTTAYVSGSDDFDIYIALVENGVPVVAVTHQPVTGMTIAAAKSSGVWFNDAENWQAAAVPKQQTPTVIVTRHWLGAPANLQLIKDLSQRIDAVAVRAATGISARSFLQPGIDAIVGVSVSDQPIGAKEWDIAPLDLIARESGGWSSDLLGQPLIFNKPTPQFPTGLILARTPALGEKIVLAIARFNGV